MPGMNGEQVAREIRGNSDLADTPIVLLTSVDQADFIRMTNEAGLSACLTKPARSSLLFDTLVGVLRREQLNRNIDQNAARRKTNRFTTQMPMPKANELPPAENINSKTEYHTVQGTTKIEDQDETAVDTDGPVSDLEESAQGDPSASAGRLAEMAARLRREREGGADNTHVDAKPAQTAVEKPTPGERLDILVAEDNEVNQQVFAEILKETGLNHLIVGNGKRAVAMHAKRNPGIILMDVSMPEMNGLEATRTIREAEQGPGGKHTPIIGVTAHALKGDRERCLNAGMDDYVTKPVSSEKLGDVIDRWLHAPEKSLAS